MRGIPRSQRQIEVLTGCSHLSLIWKGHGMADLRRQRTCLSGFSNMLINWSPERIYGGDTRAALPLATQ